MNYILLKLAQLNYFLSSNYEEIKRLYLVSNVCCVIIILIGAMIGQALNKHQMIIVAIVSIIYMIINFIPIMSSLSRRSYMRLISHKVKMYNEYIDPIISGIIKDPGSWKEFGDGTLLEKLDHTTFIVYYTGEFSERQRRTVFGKQTNCCFHKTTLLEEHLINLIENDCLGFIEHLAFKYAT